MTEVAESVVGRPHALVRGYVSAYTGYRYEGFRPGTHMGLPSRHLTGIVQFDEPLRLEMPGSADVERYDALLSGLHTEPARIHHTGAQHGVQLHVTPAGARALFGVPARELAAVAAPLDAVWGATGRELVERLAAATSWPARFAVLDRVLMRAAAGRAEVPPTSRPETTEAWRRLVASAGLVDVRSLADEVGWSRRHLTDQFTAEYGVGPKEMARVLRFERSKAMVTRADRPTMAAIAAECGYADQAHMAREWRALAGHSPTQWLAAEELPVGPPAVADGAA